MFGSDVDDASTQCFEIKPPLTRWGFLLCDIFIIMKKIVRLTESDLIRLVKRVINESKKIVYNYFKIVNKNNDIIGVGAVEKGSRNEMMIIDEIFNMGYRPVVISKKEYDDYDEGDEITNFD
jgi:hypothetical protein